MQKLKCPMSLLHKHQPAPSSARVHYSLIVVCDQSFQNRNGANTQVTADLFSRRALTGFLNHREMCRECNP